MPKTNGVLRSENYANFLNIDVSNIRKNTCLKIKNLT